MYYVYVYLDPRKPGHYVYNSISFLYEPFYIGKGKGYRMNKHLILAKKESSHMAHRIQAIWNDGMTPIILKVLDGLSEQDSLQEEIRLIAECGRRDLQIGPLVNKSGGGEKGIPYKKTREQREAWHLNVKPRLKGSHTISKENQAKMNNAAKLARLDPEKEKKRRAGISFNTPRFWLGKTRNQEYRVNISQSRKGIISSPEAVKKRAESLKGRYRIASIPVMINGVYYKSIRAAMAGTGMFRTQVERACARV